MYLSTGIARKFHAVNALRNISKCLGIKTVEISMVSKPQVKKTVRPDSNDFSFICAGVSVVTQAAIAEMPDII